MGNADILALYTRHGALTEPGEYAGEFAALPADLGDRCRFIQGLLLHADWAAAYGVAGKLSRETLPVRERMKLARSVATPTSGTCRDFALMLCAILRQNGTPARVRCGFATYFTAKPFEDHWLCEYWKADEGRWALADAQLDPLQRDHLHVRFDITDLPAGKFLNAGEAWRLWRSGKARATDFGHGDYSGPWFMRVNVMRDLKALQKCETSPWDDWRSIAGANKELDGVDLAACDRIATATHRADADSQQLGTGEAT